MSSTLARLFTFRGGITRTNRPGGVAAAVFSPSDITGLKLWLKADGTLWQDSARTTPATADADPVGAWDDASGLGVHATQGTAGNRPTLKTNILNGKPVLRFDGSSDRMVSSASAATKPFTVFAVFKAATVAVTSTMIGASATSGMHWRIDQGGAHPQQILLQDVGVIGASTGGQTTATHVDAVTYSSGGAWAFYLDGVAKGTGTDNQTFTASTTTIGYNGSNNGELCNGDLAEIIKYDSVLSTADMNRVGNYLETKYGVTWTDI